MKKLLIELIILYQKTISPDHGWLLRGKFPYGYCKFYPSCSEYTKLGISRLGVFRGLCLSVIRVLKCNPLSSPSIDNIPDFN